MAIRNRLRRLEAAYPPLAEPASEPLTWTLASAECRLALQTREHLPDLVDADPDTRAVALLDFDAETRATAETLLGMIGTLEALHAELPACTSEDAALYARLKADLPPLASPHVYRDDVRMRRSPNGWTLQGEFVCTSGEWERLDGVRSDGRGGLEHFDGRSWQAGWNPDSGLRWKVEDGSLRLPGESFWQFAERLEAGQGWQLDELYGRGGTPWTKPVEYAA